MNGVGVFIGLVGAALLAWAGGFAFAMAMSDAPLCAVALICFILEGGDDE